LYLDFDRATKFGNYQTIDLWWRETDSKNAEMMLNIARFIVRSSKWSSAVIRVLFVNNSNVDCEIIEGNILNLVEDIRVKVEIKIINNAIEQIPFYELISKYSITTDLTLLGIPNFDINKQTQFVIKTNQLFESIGSTLMVKASKSFNEINLDIVKKTAEEPYFE
jgi:solute carrier family 12 sodium/potassium/chloride transporter 2